MSQRSVRTVETTPAAMVYSRRLYSSQLALLAQRSAAELKQMMLVTCGGQRVGGGWKRPRVSCTTNKGGGGLVCGAARAVQAAEGEGVRAAASAAYVLRSARVLNIARRRELEGERCGQARRDSDAMTRASLRAARTIAGAMK